jgi:putative transposase
MSKKRTTYSSAFKTKLVLELLQNESTLAEIAAKHNILPQNLVNWKKVFLANAEIAMESSKAVKEYKEELIKSQEQNERLTALVAHFINTLDIYTKAIVSVMAAMSAEVESRMM